MMNRACFIYILLLCLFSCDQVSQKNIECWDIELEKEWHVGGYLREFYSERPSVWNDYILIGNDSLSDDQRAFLVFDKHTGELKYRNINGDTRFVIFNDIAFVAGKTLFALNLTDFHERWSVNITNNDKLLFLKNHSLYLRSTMDAHSYIKSFSADSGKNNWEYSNTWSGYWNVSPNSNLLFYTTRGFFLQAVDMNTLKTIWKLKGEKISFNDSIVYKDSLLVFGGKEETLRSLNIRTGSLNWLLTGIDKNRRSTSSTILNDNLFIAGMNTLACVNLKSGKFIWQFDHDTQYSLPLQVFHNKLYWPRVHKKIIEQYDMKTGKRIKIIPINNEITSPFAYDNGVLYYVSENTLYAEKVSL